MAGLVGQLSERFPALVGPHAADVCYATQNRQDAVRAIAADCDLLLVDRIAQLVEHAPAGGGRRHVPAAGPSCIEDESELRLEWLRGAATRGRDRRRLRPPGPGGPRGRRAGPARAASRSKNGPCAPNTSTFPCLWRSANRMGIPLRQSVKIGAYLFRQKLARRDKFPLIVELEPLFACNLACNGCGKIQYPTEILRKRLSVEQAVAAIEESRAPMVSIAGGEPLLHPEIDRMTQALLDRGRFVYLCTNALLLERKLDKFTPHPRFSWVVHIDGLRERHDDSVSRDGTFDKAVAAIRAAQDKGFKVTTNTTFFSTDSPKTVREVLDFLNDELGVDQMMISPGYAYEKAPDQVHFLSTNRSTDLFAEAFADGRRKQLAPQPQPALPRLPGGEGRLRVHAVGHSRATRCSVGSDRAISWRTGTPRPTRSCSTPPTGRSTAGARIRAAPTAWPTAAMSRARCWPPPDRSGSPCALPYSLDRWASISSAN